MSTKFGWCLTGEHRECRKVLADGKTRCSCDCPTDEHGADYAAIPDKTPEEFVRIIDRYTADPVKMKRESTKVKEDVVDDSVGGINARRAGA